MAVKNPNPHRLNIVVGIREQMLRVAKLSILRLSLCVPAGRCRLGRLSVAGVSMMSRYLHIEVLSCGLLFALLYACSGTSGGNPSGTGGVAGETGAGGSAASGGSSPAGGGAQTGGSSQAGGAFASGGSSASGGLAATGGFLAVGGTDNTGGSRASGGATTTGGTRANGGTNATGGSTMGGTSATGGGINATGGTRATGGTSVTGGTNATGGSLNQSTGGSSAPSSAGCSPGQITQTGTLLGRYGLKHFTVAGKDYIMQVNEWNSTASQTMSYGGNYFFKMTTQQASSCPAGTSCEGGTSGSPTGYPSMFIGANSKNATTNSNLPKLVSSIASVPTTWSWTDNGTLTDSTNNCYNATYDVWFSTNQAGEPNASAPTGGYLMVWFYKPADAHPIGSAPSYSGVSIPGVGGAWDIWIGNNGTLPCISYVNVGGTQSMSFDLNSFIKDAVINRPNTIQNSWYLTNVFTGFEIWRGGVGLQTTGFCVEVN